MKLDINRLLAASLVALAAGGAQAAITNSNANNGNSSVLFVAMDSGASGTPAISLAVDLGVTMADFLKSASFASASGSLSGNTTSVWNFGADTRTVNGSAVAGDYAWATTVSSFFGAAQGKVLWGVIAADNVSGAISGTNTLLNRNILTTGKPTQANINGFDTTASAKVSNAVANFQNYVSAQTGAGTQSTHAEGASTATAGNAFLNTTMKGTFGGQLPWSALSEVGTSSNLFLINQQSNPVIYQLGATGYGTDTLLASGAITARYDGAANTLTISAVPEPSELAMLLAGLGLVGAIVRRRRAV